VGQPRQESTNLSCEVVQTIGASSLPRYDTRAVLSERIFGETNFGFTSRLLQCDDAGSTDCFALTPWSVRKNE
jgi:hypothetical protein